MALRCETYTSRRTTVLSLVQFQSLEPLIIPWCNGSITGFDPVGPSSNLGGIAINSQF